MPEENGNPDPDAKRIIIHYDWKTQSVKVTWDNVEYKTFEMLLGVLEMGRLQVETMRQMVVQANIQAQVMAQQHDAQRMRSILHGK